MTIIMFAVLAVSLALIIVASHYLPQKFELNDSIHVNAPPSYLYEEINDLETWPVWSYWLRNNTQLTCSEQRTGINANCTWERGNEAGAVTILLNRGDEMVRARITFQDSVTATCEFLMEADSLDPAQTHLTMLVELSGDENGVWARWKRFLMATRSGTAFDHTLQGLKRSAESKPTFSYGISEELLAPSYYIGIEIPSTSDGPFSAEIIKAQNVLQNILDQAGVSPEGYPFSIVADSTGRTLCCIPVPPDANFPANYPILQLYSGAAIRAVDSTGYENVKMVHHEVQRYIRYREYTVNGDPWEVYQADPAQMNDPSHWITEVYYPVLLQQSE